MTADRGNALGVELDAVNRPLAMLQTHDDAVRRLGGDRQAVRPAGAVDNERMIAGRLERVGEPGEEPGAVVANGAELAVHGSFRAHDAAAEHLADRLVAEADAEDRKAAGVADKLEADAGAVGVARARRDDDALRPQGKRRLDGERVVAPNDDLGAEL